MSPPCTATLEFETPVPFTRRSMMLTASCKILELTAPSGLSVTDTPPFRSSPSSGVLPVRTVAPTLRTAMRTIAMNE